MTLHILVRKQSNLIISIKVSLKSHFSINMYVINLNTGEISYSLSAHGKECVKPVNTSHECHEAVKYFPDAVFATSQGRGIDLPYGCISDRVTAGRHYVYWHPSGKAISGDPNIRQICFEANDSLKGKKSDSKKRKQFNRL